MSKPIHTPGPARVEGHTIYALNDAGTNRFTANVQSGKAESARTTDEECAANARLLAAAYNAFDSAGRALGLNAVEMSERMADGGIAELVLALEAAQREIRAWRDGVNVRSRNMHEAKVGATYASEVAIIDALAKVRGGGV